MRFHQHNYSALGSKKIRKKPFQEESYLQIAFVNWLDSLNLGILYTASCGGMRTSIHTAKKMHASGYKRGCPDIIFFEARQSYHGLTIELKSEKGHIEKGGVQEQWKDALILRGYKALIMPTGLAFNDGLEWLKKKTKEYLGI